MMLEDPGKTRRTYAVILFLIVIYGGGYYFIRLNDWLVVRDLSTSHVPEGYSYTIVPGDSVSVETGKILQLGFYPLVYFEGYYHEEQFKRKMERLKQQGVDIRN